MENKVVAIIQARMSSSRLPGKVLKKVQDKTLIEILIHRLLLSKKIDKIIAAISLSKSDDILARHLDEKGCQYFRGDEQNVLDRYFKAAIQTNASTIVRITGDCPLIDPVIVDNTIEKFFEKKVDYCSNNNPPTFPDGLDVEVFSFNAIKKAHKEAVDLHDLEHVTPYIISNPNFKKFNYINKEDLSHERWTVDDGNDFIVVENIIKNFSPNLSFSLNQILNFKNKSPEFFMRNIQNKRNEGSLLGSGQKLYMRAKNIIPGGTMLFSKRPELFLPKLWPAYYSKSDGCNVWDLDNNKFTDMSFMGIGTNILGYNHPEVDNAVNEVISMGNMTTLNCPEEVYLAEKLIELHPWAGMVRFSRSGGEANNIAIRIARSVTGKSKVAFCGYHGWHDWYLSANLGNQSGLDGHLISGLSTKGIPEWFKGKTIPFPYNDFDYLEHIAKIKDLGVIIMEVSRNVPPKEGYLERVRQISDQNNIILIFDECTSGFRETFGGLHKKYNVEPDMAMFGKALGNGFAINAVIGKKDYFSNAEETFISSVFWTERIGSAAGLKTVEIMEKEKSWDYITKMGLKVRAKWSYLASKYDLTLNVSGLPSLSSFSINSKNWIKYKTYITQEMLKNNFLASNTIYLSTAHKNENIDEYFYHLDRIFSSIKEFEDKKNIDDFLDTSVCHDHFHRLN